MREYETNKTEHPKTGSTRDSRWGFESPYAGFVEYAAHTVWLREMNRPWEKILDLGRFQKFKKGQHIVADVATGDIAYLVSGKVQFAKAGITGQERIVFIFRSGTIFNEIPSLSERMHGAQFICLEDSKVCFFAREKVFSTKFVTEYPEIVLNLLGSLGIKSYILYSHACEMQLSSVTSQICKVFYTLVQSENSLCVNPNLTHYELSCILNVHRTTVSRAVGKLKCAGIIETFTKKKLVVTDMQKLTEIAQGKEVSRP